MGCAQPRHRLRLGWHRGTAFRIGAVIRDPATPLPVPLASTWETRMGALGSWLAQQWPWWRPSREETSGDGRPAIATDEGHLQTARKNTRRGFPRLSVPAQASLHCISPRAVGRPPGLTGAPIPVPVYGLLNLVLGRAGFARGDAGFLLPVCEALPGSHSCFPAAPSQLKVAALSK